MQEMYQGKRWRRIKRRLCRRQGKHADYCVDSREENSKGQQFGKEESQASAWFQGMFKQVSGKPCTKIVRQKSPTSQEWACANKYPHHAQSLARSTHRKCSLRPNVVMDLERWHMGHQSTMLPEKGHLSSVFSWP